MKRSFALLLPLALVACQDTPQPTALDAPEASLSRSGGTVDVIVVLKSEFAPGAHAANAARAEEIARGLGLTPRHAYGSALFGFAASVPEGRLNALRNDPRVDFVDFDAPVWLPERTMARPGSGGGGSTSQDLPFGIDRVEGEFSSTKAGDGSGIVDVDVAIIDTGIDTGHADLYVFSGKNCSKGNSYDDGNGHGTHVAGTVAAIDNGTGVVGVAPGARLWAVRVLNNAGSGTRADVICGIDFVTENAAHIEVANMSLGGSGSDDGKSCIDTTDAYKKAICNSVAAGVTYAVAAGNSSEDAANSVPAAYPMVITVSALADFDGQPGGHGSPTCRTDVDDTFANFSNYGAAVDIIAPGVCITSSWSDGGYNTISGTSMASPHVAGAAALYISTQTTRPSPADVQNVLQKAGTMDWNNSDDKDGTKEPLLNVSTF